MTAKAYVRYEPPKTAHIDPDVARATPFGSRTVTEGDTREAGVNEGDSREAARVHTVFTKIVL